MSLYAKCECGNHLRYLTTDDPEIKPVIWKIQPGGIIRCNQCMRVYTENEFRKLSNFQDTDSRSMSYEEAIANAYRVRNSSSCNYKSDTSEAAMLFCLFCVLYLIGTVVCVWWF